MSTTKELRGTDAIEKYKEIVSHNPICMFLTRPEKNPMPSRPMATQKVCDQGNFWFLSSRSSMKNEDIAKNPDVQLIFSNPSDSEFLSVSGKASVVNDEAKKKELWGPLTKAWFPDGVEDPDLTVIKVSPDEGHYWDTKNGKIISMLKIVAAAVTGHPADAGVHGNVKL